MEKNLYDSDFYLEQSDWSYRSAKIILPSLFEIIETSSIADLGCGVGTWLKAAKELGIKKVHWFDGDYVDRAQLRISPEEFTGWDIGKDIQNKEKFDLAISLEVSEHIRSDSIDQFADNLCSLSDAILFSCAAPWQMGVGHINEKWPGYWKSVFEERWYSMFDVVRPFFSNDKRVEFWYRQNSFLFVKSNRLGESRFSRLAGMEFSDELYSVHKSIVASPLTFAYRWYQPKIIDFTKKIRLYWVISKIVRASLWVLRIRKKSK